MNYLKPRHWISNKVLSLDFSTILIYFKPGLSIINQPLPRLSICQNILITASPPAHHDDHAHLVSDGSVTSAALGSYHITNV